MKQLQRPSILFLLIVLNNFLTIWGGLRTQDVGCFKDTLEDPDGYARSRENSTGKPGPGRALTGYFTENEKMHFVKCILLCDARSFKFAGIQNSTQCFCGNEGYDKYGKAEKPCSASCVEFKYWVCGDVFASTVHRIGPRNWYFGCFKDHIDKLDNYSIEIENNTGIPAPGRALTGYFTYGNYMHVQLCFEICEERGYRYVGLQGSNQCFCGNWGYDRYGRDENGCNMRCAGSIQAFCGGEKSNAVYEIYHRPYTGLNIGKK